MDTDYTLAYGTHAAAADGRCAMEWVSYLADEAHSDEPACVSRVLRAYCTALNDALDDEPRQRLRPYLTRTIGTAQDGLDEQRSWMALDWLIREYGPTWLAAAHLIEPGQRLWGLPQVADGPSLQQALQALEQARRETREAWAAELGGSRFGVRAMSWAAGRSAARSAAWASAGAAAWAAARVAVGDIAGDRARASARAVGGNAAAIAARQARLAAEPAAARCETRVMLAPTLARLEASSLALLDRMLPTETLSIAPLRALAHVI